MQTKYDELRESGKRKRLTYREEEPKDPAAHELWRLENLIEDGELLSASACELTDEEALALGKIHTFIKKMCGRRSHCGSCPYVPMLNRLGYGNCSEYACVQILTGKAAQ